jgi:hypothetical protein
MANIARVTPRTLWSGKVANANAANATYAASANTNLFATNSTCRSRAKIWCTGKDSNLRTSEEGQIYSLLALTTHPPVH